MGVVLEYKTRTLALLEEEYDSNYQIVKHLHSQVPTFRDTTYPEIAFISSASGQDKEESL